LKESETIGVVRTRQESVRRAIALRLSPLVQQVDEGIRRHFIPHWGLSPESPDRFA
jgi:hypothetical protein